MRHFRVATLFALLLAHGEAFAGAVATVRTVNSVADTTDGVCDAASCTLREALQVAQAGDTIGFSSLFDTPRTIQLQSALPSIAVANLTINGPGASRLVVRRAAAAPFRILFVASGASAVISGLTLSNGLADDGAGLANQGQLTLSDCLIAGNTATGFAAGVRNDGTIAIRRCTIAGNTAQDAAALANYGAATLENATISGNRATGQVGGTMINVNPGIGSPTLALVNCTFADNAGGSAPTLLTFTPGTGPVTTTLKNTIFGPSVEPALDQVGNGATVTSLGNNIAANDPNVLLAAPSDLIPVDAELGPLQQNGSGTPTHQPSLTSPAVNAGSNSGAPATDQRGVPRPQGGTVDIGAVELRPLVLSTFADPGDGACDASCTLRDAVLAANANDAIVDDIYFPASAVPVSIDLGAALPNIGSTTWNGIGADRLTIRRSSGGDYTVLVVPGTAFVRLSDLTIANGKNMFVGGIDNFGTLLVQRSAITGNAADVNSGGIENHRTLVVRDSTISGNSAGSDGGGLYNVDPGFARLVNTTISGNSSPNFNGGVTNINFGTTDVPRVELLNCTVAGNTGANNGGGVASFTNTAAPAVVELENTIVSGNTPANLAKVGANAAITSLGHNLASDGGGGFLVGPGDLVNTDPLLSPLVYAGGGTRIRLPDPASPAIDAASDATAPPFDQRGAARPQGAHADIGAVEVLPNGVFADSYE